MNILVCNTEVKNVGGLFCLNDLHKASGGAEKHKTKQFLRNEQTKALVQGLESEGLISPSLKVVQGGRTEDRGTYACKELVYAYAMWISPEFHIHVIRAYDAMVTGAKPEPEPTSQIEILAQMVLSMAEQEKETRAHAEQLEEIRDDVDFLNSVPTIPRVIRPSKFVGNGFVVSLEGVKLRPAMFNLVEQFVERYNRTRDGKHEINVNSIVHAALEQFLYNSH